MASTGGVVYVVHRQVAGIFATSLTALASKKNWKPSSVVPIGKTASGEAVYVETPWSKYFSDLGGRKLGGATFPTLPELTDFITQSNQNATAIAAIQTALQQMVTANAQTAQALTQVVQSAGLTGSGQIPPPVLAPQEYSGGGDGAGGGSGGGGGDGGGD